MYKRLRTYELCNESNINYAHAKKYYIYHEQVGGREVTAGCSFYSTSVTKLNPGKKNGAHKIENCRTTNNYCLKCCESSAE